MSEMMLSLHAGANSSAAIGNQGRLLYCVQEECQSPETVETLIR